MAAAHIYYVNDEVKEQLRDKATELGLCGGILTYQLGPDKTARRPTWFSPQLGLLGEISFESEAAKDKYFRTSTQNWHVFSFLAGGVEPHS